MSINQIFRCLLKVLVSFYQYLAVATLRYFVFKLYLKFSEKKFCINRCNLIQNQIVFLHLFWRKNVSK
jgi:hypothetical protein